VMIVPSLMASSNTAPSLLEDPWVSAEKHRRPSLLLMCSMQRELHDSRETSVISLSIGLEVYIMRRRAKQVVSATSTVCLAYL
jgi:hypothetical protein